MSYEDNNHLYNLNNYNNDICGRVRTANKRGGVAITNTRVFFGSNDRRSRNQLNSNRTTNASQNIKTHHIPNEKFEGFVEF
jgi:hypothetical protein